jgi:hypothetical protein
VLAIFVHLGGQLPDHLIANMRYVKDTFPSIRTILIIDRELPQHADLVDSTYLYEGRDQVVQNLFAGSKNDLRFRNGFWRSSLERIFAIIEFVDSQPIEVPLLHIESDVFLTPNFPWEKIEKFNRGQVGWLPYSHEEDVAALMYFRSKAAAKALKEALIKSLEENSSITDMKALRKVFDMLYPRSFYFPISGLRNYEDENSRERIPHYLKTMEHTEAFGGIFDSLALGMFFTGVDPRNNYGMYILHDEKQYKAAGAIINPKKLDLIIVDSNKLFVEDSNKRYLLFNLHLHSKRIELFGPNWARVLQKLIRLNKNRKIESFSGKILIQQIRENSRSGTLSRYLLEPTLRKYRTVIRSKSSSE